MEIQKLLCPLTKKIFLEPVVLNSGMTYEYEAIKEWVRYSSKCPITGQEIKSAGKNLVLKELISHKKIYTVNIFFNDTNFLRSLELDRENGNNNEKNQLNSRCYLKDNNLVVDIFIDYEIYIKKTNCNYEKCHELPNYLCSSLTSGLSNIMQAVLFSIILIGTFFYVIIKK